MSSSAKDTKDFKDRQQNNFGADLWHNTAGRGLFAGLQDTKKYNVDHGWARREQGEQPGLIATIWRRYVLI
ncbi:hypothetical protein N7495_004730 [Penicillium taxi]|uniref:uncharacterized protein n=1 Tax=Penicillium taxi TaxID=168475 RepID=UPI0025455CE0|nr:uncharacterized protein N7495_004730 [Penicillium taxi]KAJ5899986.1 hypothetical protein N7495_004730 [Penicillium taxi]